jgi:hypothetical protein
MWNAILTEMLSKVAGVREQSWRTFRNAILFQSRFMSFILGNDTLEAKFRECFSSLDGKVQECMVIMLPSLARPLSRPSKKDDDRQNLFLLWEKLSDPSVRIAGKIRSAFKSSRSKLGMNRVRTALSDFVRLIVEGRENRCEGGVVLSDFVEAAHHREDLAEMMDEIGGLVVGQ